MNRWLVLLLAVAGVAAAAPESYVLDGAHTAPMFEIRHQNMSLQRGFFTESMGTIELDRAAKTGSIDVVVSTGSIVTSSRVLTDILKRSDWFSAEQHPAMRYTASRMTFDGDVPVTADGELTILGVTRAVTLAITDFRCGTHIVYRRAMCSAQATATIRRSDFGMTAGLPDVAGNEVRVVIPVEAMVR